MSEIQSTADILKKIRSGYKADLKLKYGDYEIPCRLMAASEERSVIGSARVGVKVVHEGSRDLDESLAVMKAVLQRGCTVENTPYLSKDVLDNLTNGEIQELFDQYTTTCNTVNPEFESLSASQVIDLINEIKKKNQKASDLFTWQLAAIGRYFLDDFLPRVSAPGS